MKRIFLISTLWMLGSVVYGTTSDNTVIVKDTIIQISEEWHPDADGAWVGVNKSLYKFDSKKELYWSKDGKKWNSVKSGSWQDINGKWLKIENGTLQWSADGKEWERVADSKWQGYDGNWYMFDTNGQLLVSKDAGDKV